MIELSKRNRERDVCCEHQVCHGLHGGPDCLGEGGTPLISHKELLKGGLQYINELKDMIDHERTQSKANIDRVRRERNQLKKENKLLRRLLK